MLFRSLDQDTTNRLGNPIFVNGTKEERIFELINHEQNSNAHALWCIRGGVGAIELIETYTPPKRSLPLIGFSDVTVLHLHRFLYDKRIGIHAPVAHQSCSEQEQKMLSSLLLQRKICYPTLQAINNNNLAKIKGELIVMNLASLQSMLGYIDNNFFKGVILAIEDNNIKHYQWYRAMQQLKNAQILQNISGLIIGHIDNERKDCLKTTVNLANEYGLSVFDWPYFGHESPNLPLLFGGLVNLVKINSYDYELVYQ